MANTYLTRTAGSTGNRRTWTFSAWVKRSRISNADATQMLFGTYTDSSNRLEIGFHNANNLVFKEKSGGSTTIDFTSTQLFKDVHGWYNIIVAVDTTQSTNTNRVKIYVNGSQITAWNDSTYPAEDYDTLMNVSGRAYNVGQEGSNSYYFNGLMSHVHFVDGTQYTASTFGSTDSTTGEWKINTSPTLTMGTNGFTILKDGNTITDQSSNSNNFSSGGGTLTKTEDNPSNVFNVWNYNYLTRHHSESTSIPGMLQNGNTTFNSTANTFKGWKAGTIGVTSGKFYWEAKPTDNGRMYMGVCYPNVMLQLSTPFYESTIYSGVSVNSDGDIFGRYTGSAIDSDASNASIANNDIVGFALDMDNHALYIHKNGTYFESGDPTSGSSRTGSVVEQLTGSRANYLGSGEPVAPMVGDPSSSGTHLSQFNFGNGYFGSTQISSAGTNASGIGIFEYDVPAGYTALCTKGLNE